MPGPAHCDVCDRTWPESKWTIHDGEFFYWCPICSLQIDMFPEGPDLDEPRDIREVDSTVSVSAFEPSRGD